MRFVSGLALGFAVVAMLASCGPQIGLVTKDRALRGGGIHATGGSTWARGPVNSGVYQTSAPSESIVMAASSKPKDKHGMPFYGHHERVRYVRTTAYTSTEADHLIYGQKNAVGTQLRYSERVRSAAADWSVYPVGTVFRIKGMPQLFVVDDYGSALTGTGTIDIYTPTKEHMKAWGRRNVEVAVVRWGSYAQSAQILSKRTSYAHCSQMYTNIMRRMGAHMATAAR